MNLEPAVNNGLCGVSRLIFRRTGNEKPPARRRAKGFLWRRPAENQPERRAADY
jgi:hypothetical protein